MTKTPKGRLKPRPPAHTLDKNNPCYKQGFKDAGILLKMGLSLWIVSNYSGMGRKSPTQSHKKLYAYCEGFQNRVKKAAKRKGIKIPVHSAYGLPIFSQEDIGK